MTNQMTAVFIFKKDYTDKGADEYYLFLGEALEAVTPEFLCDFSGTLVVHDFWLIRDAMFDRTGRLPQMIIDLDEFRIAISGNPDDRKQRDRTDIYNILVDSGADEVRSSQYRKMFNREIDFDLGIAGFIASKLLELYDCYCSISKEKAEYDRFFNIEVPAFNILQLAATKGVPVNRQLISDLRKTADHDFFMCLKSASSKHNIPLEIPSDDDLEAILVARGFDLSGVSVDYILEFLPHDNGFGEDILALKELHAARNILAALTLASTKVRPLVDVFGSRTSRVFLKVPHLQNLPKRYRQLIQPRDGSSIAYVDFDQFEVGIMAALSGDAELRQLFAAGDMYELFSSDHLKLAGKRKSAKQLFLSYAYGMSRKSLVDAAVSLGADRDVAKLAFRRFPAYEDWKESVASEFLREGRIGTSEGNYFVRQGKGQLSAKERRAAVSQVVQGTASLIFKKAVIQASAIDDLEIILPMHDALLFCYKDRATPEKVVATFASVMTEHFKGVISGKASLGDYFND